MTRRMKRNQTPGAAFSPTGGAPAGDSQGAAWQRARTPRAIAVPQPYTEVVGERASNAGVWLFSAVLFAVTFVAALGAWSVAAQRIGAVAVACALVAAALAVMGIHIAQQWEKVVVLRLGKFNRVSGPGLFWTIPVIEQNVMRVDGRVRVTAFGAEETLTSDLVPLNVNAVLFWMVWDAKAACTEVGDFTRAVELAAQTALRDAIGRANVAEVAIRRDQLDRELKRVLAEKVADWGITVLSVEVRDILLPKELQEAMSLEAQAEQRRKARIILMEGEQDICDMLDSMGKTYAGNDEALRLRAMHLLYESVRETGGTVVMPSSFSEGFGDVLGDSMKDALSGKGKPSASGGGAATPSD